MQTQTSENNGRLNNQTTRGVLSYRAIQQMLTEKDKDGEILRACVVEDLVTPSNGFKSLLHIGNPYEANPAIITLPSRINSEEANNILATIVPVPEFCYMLEHVASAYHDHRIAIIEGETSIGKTLAVNTFTKLLYGANVKPLDFYCVGQTDVDQLMGKWVPNIEEVQIAKELKKLTSDPQTAELLQGIDTGDKTLAPFVKMAAIFNAVSKRQWTFQLGIVPKAMLGSVDFSGQFLISEDGSGGFILHVQEIGLAKPAVVDAFLKLRGERARLAESIQLWEDGGRTVQKGEGCFLVMSTNPPENYIERNEIDVALVRASSLLRLGHLSGPSLAMISKAIFTNALPSVESKRPPYWGTDLRDANELGKEIASLLALFHEKAVATLAGGEPGRVQRILPTTDDFDAVYAKIINEQILSEGPTGILEVDIIATLSRAVSKVYKDRLASNNIKNQLDGIWNELLNNDLGKVEFRGVMQTRADIISTLCAEYLSKVRAKPNSEAFSIEEERASIEVMAQIEQGRKRWSRLAAAGVLKQLSGAKIK